MRPLIAGVLCLAPAALAAQSDPKSDILIGRITDLAGRPVSDAQVGATSLGTGLTRFHTTNEEGTYRIVFPEHARQYVVSVKRVGFSPVQRTITRRSEHDEQMRIDLQFGGTPLALSAVEITGGGGDPAPRAPVASPAVDGTVPNPVAEILALKDTLHLSAVQIVALSDIADTLQVQNSAIHTRIRSLLTKSQEAGDITQMAGSVAMMLEEASRNTERAILDAQKLLRPEQWIRLPQVIRDRPVVETSAAPPKG
jgi:hypothetical protein